MTDRELLEKAAKAAGMNIRIYEGMIVERGTDCVCVNEQGFKWNPLTDNGDALTLAVILRMDLTFNEMDAFAWPSNGEDAKSELISVDDPYAATRRAIVRAAAAIGETL